MRGGGGEIAITGGLAHLAAWLDTNRCFAAMWWRGPDAVGGACRCVCIRWCGPRGEGAKDAVAAR